MVAPDPLRVDHILVSVLTYVGPGIAAVDKRWQRWFLHCRAATLEADTAQHSVLSSHRHRECSMRMPANSSSTVLLLSSAGLEHMLPRRL
jgi:hypothetical protein